MFRKLLLFVVICTMAGFISAAAALILLGDKLLLNQIRKETSRLAPTKMEIGELHSRLLGSFELILGNVEVSQESSKTNIRQLKLSSPLSALSLLFAYRAGMELPLNLENFLPVQFHKEVVFRQLADGFGCPSRFWPSDEFVPWLTCCNCSRGKGKCIHQKPELNRLPIFLVF